MALCATWSLFATNSKYYIVMKTRIRLFMKDLETLGYAVRGPPKMEKAVNRSLKVLVALV